MQDGRLDYGQSRCATVAQSPVTCSAPSRGETVSHRRAVEQGPGATHLCTAVAESRGDRAGRRPVDGPAPSRGDAGDGIEQDPGEIKEDRL